MITNQFIIDCGLLVAQVGLILLIIHLEGRIRGLESSLHQCERCGSRQCKGDMSAVKVDANWRQSQAGYWKNLCWVCIEKSKVSP